MPKGFTKSFAGRLNKICKLNVKEAVDMEPILGGNILIAPGNRHMIVDKNGSNFRVKLSDAPKVHYQRPAVDVLFNSMAKNVGKNSIGVILTGMGKDGAEGLLRMKKAGALTIAQDKESSAVWGMPREAVRIGASDLIVPLSNMVNAIIKMLD